MQWDKPSNADTRDDLSLLDLRVSLYHDNKRWMRPSLSHPPESRRLFVAGSVCWIISGLVLREPLHADGVALCDPVLERVTAEMLTASLQTIGNAAKKIISMIEDSGEQIEEGEGEQSPAPLDIPA